MSLVGVGRFDIPPEELRRRIEIVPKEPKGEADPDGGGPHRQGEIPPEELKRRRYRLGWSRTRLAAEMGSSPQAISQWESGLQPIPKWVPTLLSVFETCRPMKTAS